MGLFKKLFKRKKGNKSKVAETSRQTTKVEEREEEQPVTRSNTPEHPEQQNYNESNLPSDYRTDRPAVDKLHQPRVPPSAREAAFHGPPRFGWVDIETVAAIKVQAAYRRFTVMNRLEREGVSTSAIRNRRRRRKAAQKKQEEGYGMLVTSEDTPSFLSCCAVGLAFGDATEEDEKAYRDFQKKQYENRVKQQQMHEDAIRKQYLRSHGAGVGRVVEEIEVID